MQHESVLFCCLSFLHSEQSCELHMCNTQFSMQVKKYEEEREEWIHTHTNKKARLLLLWHTTGWHHVPSKNIARGDTEAFSRVSSNKGESFSAVRMGFLAVISPLVKAKLDSN